VGSNTLKFEKFNHIKSRKIERMKKEKEAFTKSSS
jgi:hypothetical protein